MLGYVGFTDLLTPAAIFLKVMQSDELDIPYSGKLSQMKTSVNFAVWGHFAKVLPAKIFIEYSDVIINGHVIVVSHNS